MKIRISILCLASTLLSAGETAETEKKSPIALLPNGSVLHGVLLPRYDEQRNLVGDLRAETMTLIDGARVEGQNVAIKFYHPDRSLKASVSLQKALFNQDKSTLRATEPVRITGPRLEARGSGLVYSFQSGKGYLNGPASTWISPPPPAPTSMNTKQLSFPAAALALSVMVAHAAPPAFVTEEEKAALESDSELVDPEISASHIAAESRLEADTKAAKEATGSANAFIKEQGIRTASSEKSLENRTPAKPLQVEAGADDTVITCTGGMYFDSEAGILVYQGNVKAVDPRFTLSGADELKVFFDNKNADAEKKEDKDPAGSPADFGEVRKLVAEGVVRILQNGVGGKKPVEASGKVLTYDVPKGEIIIHGGFPWVKQGNFYARAKEADLTLRLLNNGSFSTRGNWEMGGNLNLKGN